MSENSRNCHIWTINPRQVQISMSGEYAERAVEHYTDMEKKDLDYQASGNIGKRRCWNFRPQYSQARLFRLYRTILAPILTPSKKRKMVTVNKRASHKTRSFKVFFHLFIRRDKNFPEAKLSESKDTQTDSRLHQNSNDLSNILLPIFRIQAILQCFTAPSLTWLNISQLKRPNRRRSAISNYIKIFDPRVFCP